MQGVWVWSPEAKIPHASWPKTQNMKQKQYCNNSLNKDLKRKSEKSRYWLRWDMPLCLGQQPDFAQSSHRLVRSVTVRIPESDEPGQIRLGSSEVALITLHSRTSNFKVYPVWASSWLSGKESACQCKRPRLDSWVRKIPWRRNGYPLQYSGLGGSIDRGAWTGHSPWGHKDSDTTEWLRPHMHVN